MSKSVKLTAKWQLDAALLSRPVDLTALVTMSRSSPEMLIEDNTLHRLVSSLLNEKNDKKSDKDTKLDVLNILANVATGSRAAVAEARTALQGVSEWFDEYMAQEETTGGQEPELNKAMVLLLARCWEYKLKTEDVLELTQGNRKIALCTVVGLLEDGETYSTELKQRQKPEQGKMGQWEHELVVHRYEKPLLMQICRLLRGFTHPGTYFDSSTEEIALFSVERFAEEMDTLLEITLRSNLVEKLSMALYDCLFGDEEEDEAESKSSGDGTLSEFDHIAITAVHAFLQNLYFYATENIEEYRRHMLMETLLIPRLVLPYLDRCVIHATILNTRAEAYSDMLEGDCVAEMALHNPQLVKGIAASLRTLIIASFRAPATQFVMTLLRRLNPTAQILRASAFCRHHEYIFALLCMLNINMGALNISNSKSSGEEDLYATQLLAQLATIYHSMNASERMRVCKRVQFSGALPISRDTESYTAMMSVLDGGVASQLEYVAAGNAAFNPAQTQGLYSDQAEFLDSRAEAKKAHAERMQHLRLVDENRGRGSMDHTDPTHGTNNTAHSSNNNEGKQQSAFQIAVSVAHASDNKDAKASSRHEHKHNDSNNGDNKTSSDPSENNKFRLLGDLPSLAGDRGKNATAAVALSLALHSNEQNPHAAHAKFMQNNAGADSKSEGPGKAADNIPKEFLCAINGHVMKEPVKAPSGLVFEQATIELWLNTRGAVCPITNTHLERGDLQPEDDLRNRIKRYHIQQTAMRRTNVADDDLYDF
eukprot:CAMPEP_0184977100 /NCGR_PEP_ID=MMETSP1098-20130426/7851_1 /TAXON_ID=89044 /ORGANISM="Spumella elongata, Strain CCAP 955/1" /LENGTH=765 /DNA_ID=CAMNT_0027500049 /DNA_START=110 /DNA_END=2407 /DNA_ORIENTATION=-